LGECDESLRTKAESGESEPTYRKAIAWDVLPFGVRLKRWLAPLHGGWWERLLRNGSREREVQYHEEGTRQTDREEQDE